MITVHALFAVLGFAALLLVYECHMSRCVSDDGEARRNWPAWIRCVLTVGHCVMTCLVCAGCATSPTPLTNIKVSYVGQQHYGDADGTPWDRGPEPGTIVQIAPLEDKVYEVKPGSALTIRLRCKVMDPSFNGKGTWIFCAHRINDRKIGDTKVQGTFTEFSKGFIRVSPSEYHIDVKCQFEKNLNPGKSVIYVCMIDRLPFGGDWPKAALSNILVQDMQLVASD